MQPNLIKSTAKSSLTMLGGKGSGTPEALLLAWVSWEGLTIRVLVVGLAMQCWKVQNIYDVLSEDKVHELAHVRGLFEEVFVAYPDSAKGVRQSWK